MSQLYPLRSKPFKGMSAFERIGEDTTPSQAAVLLSFGNQIRGGETPMRARAAGRRRQRFMASEPEAAFPVPKLTGLGGHAARATIESYTQSADPAIARAARDALAAADAAAR